MLISLMLAVFFFKGIEAGPEGIAPTFLNKGPGDWEISIYGPCKRVFLQLHEYSDSTIDLEDSTILLDGSDITDQCIRAQTDPFIWCTQLTLDAGSTVVISFTSTLNSGTYEYLGASFQLNDNGYFLLDAVSPEGASTDGITPVGIVSPYIVDGNYYFNFTVPGDFYSATIAAYSLSAFSFGGLLSAEVDGQDVTDNINFIIDNLDSYVVIYFLEQDQSFKNFNAIVSIILNGDNVPTVTGIGIRDLDPSLSTQTFEPFATSFTVATSGAESSTTTKNTGSIITTTKTGSTKITPTVTSISTSSLASSSYFTNGTASSTSASASSSIDTPTITGGIEDGYPQWDITVRGTLGSWNNIELAFTKEGPIVYKNGAVYVDGVQVDAEITITTENVYILYGESIPKESTLTISFGGVFTAPGTAVASGDLYITTDDGKKLIKRAVTDYPLSFSVTSNDDTIISSSSLSESTTSSTTSGPSSIPTESDISITASGSSKASRTDNGSLSTSYVTSSDLAATTVITTTTCEDHKCYPSSITTGVKIVTTIENGVATTYTTYCPLSSELGSHTSITKLTEDTTKVTETIESTHTSKIIETVTPEAESTTENTNTKSTSFEKEGSTSTKLISTFEGFGNRI